MGYTIPSGESTMKASRGKLITLRMTNGAFRLLGRKHCVIVLRYLERHPKGSILNDIDYDIPIKSHKLASDLLGALVEAKWARRDDAKLYFLTDEGRAALHLAESDEAKVLVPPPERKGRGSSP